jgi:hypothetical protein
LSFDDLSAPDEAGLGFDFSFPFLSFATVFVFFASLVMAISPLASDAILAPKESESLSLWDPEPEPDALKLSEKKKKV